MEHRKGSNTEGEVRVFRVRFPRQGEFIGLIDQRVGGSRMLVKCGDGKVRNCKVPGRYRRNLWIREGDYVLVQPWEFDDTKGDVVFKYNPNDVNSLREKGFLKGIDDAL